MTDVNSPITHALKEWPVICEHLISGRQRVIYRKGGIAEKGFKPLPEKFYLMPAYFHQTDLSDLKSHWHLDAGCEITQESAVVPIKAWAQITDQYQVTDLEDLFIDFDEHAYGGNLLLRRWFYKPDRPLWRLTLDVHALDEVLEVPNRDTYRKCRSWFELDAGDVL